MPRMPSDGPVRAALGETTHCTNKKSGPLMQWAAWRQVFSTVRNAAGPTASQLQIFLSWDDEVDFHALRFVAGNLVAADRHFAEVVRVIEN